jgi:urea transport system permease protein
VVPSIEMVLWVAVGGRGTIAGAAVGALLVSWARSYLSESYPDTWLFALGALFVGSVVLFPRGVAGLVIDAVERVQRLLNRRIESEPAAPQEATGALSGPQHPAPVEHAASGTLDPTETAAAAGRSMS